VAFAIFGEITLFLYPPAKFFSQNGVQPQMKAIVNMAIKVGRAWDFRSFVLKI
jgi:hypothetical protein